MIIDAWVCAQQASYKSHIRDARSSQELYPRHATELKMQQKYLNDILFATTLVFCLCLVTSHKIAQPQIVKRSYQDAVVPSMTRELRNDVSQLLLKKLRFRDLDGAGESETMQKRRQERLVNNLAALLSGLRQRQVESSQMRMPSLRFG